MNDIYKKAHILTKKISQEYGDVDYKTQFKLCLSYLSDENINKRIEEILDEVNVSEEEARRLEMAEFFLKNHFKKNENVEFKLWKRLNEKRVYISAPYIDKKLYLDLNSNILFDKNKKELKKF